METRFESMKSLPQDHLLQPGTAMCSGCGGLEAVKLMQDVLGPKTLFVNAAGCMTLLNVYPNTPFPGSWLYTAMGSAPAGAQGVRDALDIQLEKGRLAREQDLQVVVLTGDGAAGGIGMSATSAAIERGLDFIYLCYDNEGYGNTGHQTSTGTPHGAYTATDTAGYGVTGEKKDLFSIWAAHRPSYIATITAAEPVDLARKIEQAKSMRGPRLLIALSPCPTGWHSDPRNSVKIGKLAVKTGIWPLKEYKNGKVTHTKRPQAADHRPPVEDYLKLQGRFDHLFHPEKRETTIMEIQASVDRYWEKN